MEGENKSFIQLNEEKEMLYTKDSIFNDIQRWRGHGKKGDVSEIISRKSLYCQLLMSNQFLAKIRDIIVSSDRQSSTEMAKTLSTLNEVITNTITSNNRAMANQSSRITVSILESGKEKILYD